MDTAQLAELLRQLNKNLTDNSRLMEGIARAQGINTNGGLRPGDRASSPPGSGRNPYRETRESLEKYDTNVAKLNKMTGNFTNDIAAARRALNEVTKKWESGDTDESFEMYRTGIGTLGVQAERLAKGMGRFTDATARATKAQSLLYAAQLQNTRAFKDYEIEAYLNRLTSSLDDLDEGAKASMGLIDKATKKLRTDIGIDEFVSVRNRLGEFEASITEQLASMRGVDGNPIKSMADLVKIGPEAFKGGGALNDADPANQQLQKNRDALVMIAAEAAAKGLYTAEHDKANILDKDGKLKGAAELAQVDFHALAEGLQKITAGVSTTTAKLDNTVQQYVSPWQRAVASVMNGQGRKALVGSLKDWIMSGVMFSTMVKGLKQAYSELTNFNIAQVPQSFLQTQKDAVMMGMSFQDTVKLLQENKRILAIYGPGEFKTAVGGMQNTFRKFGYTMQQSAELIAPTIEGAITGGVDVRDQNQLTSYTNSMMNSFQQIAGVVDISAKEFLQLNSQLFKSEGTFENLVGMDKTRRAAYQNELVQLRTRYVLGGLDIQQAQKLIEIQQQQARESVKSRIDAGGKLMSYALFSGMDLGSATRLMTLRNKGSRTADEDNELRELTGKLGSSIEQQRAGEAAQFGGNTYFTDAFRDAIGLDSSDLQVMHSANQMNLAKDANATVSPAEQQRAAAAAKGSEAVAAFGDKVNQVSSALSNSLLAALFGAGGSLAALALQAGFAAASLGRLAGANVAGAAAAGGGGVMGSMMGNLGKSSKWIKGAGIVGTLLNVGMMGSALMDDNLSQKDKFGAVGGGLGGSLGSIAGGAIGSMLLPGVGTIAGSMLGGWLGSLGGKALGSQFGSPDLPTSSVNSPNLPTSSVSGPFGNSGSPNSPSIVAAEGINTTSPSGSSSLFDVADRAVRNQLESLNQTMTRVADILDKMYNGTSAPDNKPKTLARNQPIADQNSYLTGQS
jgi:hypothetical protein